jgi:hypothetical protein
MFDESFPGGLSGDRFGGDQKGYRMHANSLLNITWGLAKFRKQISGAQATQEVPVKGVLERPTGRIDGTP